MKEIPFFKGLSRTGSLERLCSFTLKEAILACIFEDFKISSFFVKNYRDKCLIFSSPRALIYVLVEKDSDLLKEIEEIFKQKPHLNKAVAQVELDLDISKFEHHFSLGVEDIIGGGIKRGTPCKSLFFTLLKDLYGVSHR